MSAAVARISSTRQEAADAIGCSIDHFERWIQPDLRLVRSGRLKLVPVRELERWVDEQAEHVLEGAA